jgi:hypothetical protein
MTGPLVAILSGAGISTAVLGQAAAIARARL